MLTHNQIEKLKANWGDKADSFDCKAEVRVYDPLSSWECYIYAMNPREEDEIMCVIKAFHVQVINWKISDMLNCFNAEGEGAIVDIEFHPREIKQIYKKLKGIYESNTD